ncbi:MULTISPECIES: sugar porter family MFS transporter [Leuconostoc]|uniref:MFS transporter n=1 Tax=Leuconostoc pseudomesenteroides TaxID=33968 RepID=A0A1X0VC75_LEUPS|nr:MULTISPECIES: sugar porter family MFS transporter [Leuconostoc]KDA47147.1 Major myo-inositol transporter IolT [Leuconostoc pseudomesenteroides 1159]KDA50683.1 Major myo-inositol transporter IolT [Leuconostoc pseudomesenteroides PS12]CCJ66744.1 Major myo-inositol transporter IolT [Leuconostoc pseudomesenteroides 4882]MCT4419453.1 MFS transporter [Leuconostoc falkenbergense]MDG9744083.1 sugar porter family MFS transporter [Leuconostoc falkenbergense]
MQNKTNKKVKLNFLNYCVYVISLGGFLFGYDTGVINGALAFMSRSDQLNLTPSLQGIVSSSLVIGACIGALGCGKVADKFGRKKTLRLIAIIFTVATVLCAAAVNFWSMSIFRFVLGIAVGAASSLSPMYLAEISPDNLRSANVNKNAIFIVLGQLCAFVVNAILGNIWSDWGPIWRVMVLSAAVPSVILWINSFHISGSPQWLLFKRRFNRARQLFRRLGFKNTNSLIKNETEAIEKSDDQEFSWSRALQNKKLLYLLITGIVIALIQQISGVNTVMYYGTILLEKVGMGEGGSLYANILIGVVSVIASIFGTRMIEKTNHHRILIIGLIGNVVFLALLGAIMKSTVFSQTVTNALVLIALTLFLANHQGIVSPVTWLLLAEMFPGKVKAQFMSVATATTWITNFFISLIYPQLIAWLGTAVVFFVFALTNGISIVLSILFVNSRKMSDAYQTAKL